MSTINISLSEALKNFVGARVAGGADGAGGEYVREQIRRDWDRRQLRRLLLDGAASALGAPVDRVYFDGLRARARLYQAG